MKKIFVWGCGISAIIFYKELKHRQEVFNDQIIAFVDSNEELWGKSFHEWEIMPPFKMAEYSFDRLVISNKKIKDIESIRNDAQNKYGINEAQIIVLDEYRIEKNIEFVVGRNNHNILYADNMLATKKIVVYTAITGNYDTLRDPEYIDKNIDYICYTNNKTIMSDIWELRYIEDRNIDNRMLARKVKMLPHELLHEYDVSVWVDAKLHIVGDLHDLIREYGGNQPILCFPHFERNCLYQEAAKCMTDHLDDDEIIISQISRYYSEGYPFRNGLYETGCIVRRHNDPMVVRLMMMWLEEVKNNSRRDQLSFPYVCWKLGINPTVCDKAIYDNKWMKLYSHNSIFSDT